MRSVFCGAYTGKTLLAGYVVEGENECMEYQETILIVDDSALNRMVLIEILGKENYTFLEAENGQQAVELLDCHPEVDLLLLDITMPEIDGFGVPLRYNYDKPEKPRISRVFGYLARFFILFQTEKSSREVVIS